MLSSRLLPGAVALALTVSLAACGGGGGTSAPAPVVGPTAAPTGSPSAPPTGAGINAYPASLSFSAPGAAPQAFVVRLSGTNAATPQLSTQCGSVATVTTTSSTFPATYTVTPLAVGGCTVVFTAGNSSAAVSITVGTSGGGIVTPGSSTTLALTVGQSGTFSASASAGTLGADTTACSGVANVTLASGGGTASQTFNVSAVAAGTCAVTLYDGAFSFQENIVVTNSGVKNSVTVTPAALTFTSPTAAAQTIQIGFTGSVGAVSIDESSCDSTASGGAKIAYLTLVGTTPGQSVSLPIQATVQPFGAAFGGGTCQIVFTPQTGAAATLLVSVGP